MEYKFRNGRFLAYIIGNWRILNSKQQEDLIQKLREILLQLKLKLLIVLVRIHRSLNIKIVVYLLSELLFLKFCFWSICFRVKANRLLDFFCRFSRYSDVGLWTGTVLGSLEPFWTQRRHFDVVPSVWVRGCPAPRCHGASCKGRRRKVSNFKDGR